MDENNHKEKQKESEPVRESEIKKLKSVEDRIKREFEDEKIQEEITEKVTEAEKMIRNYELEIKKGNFNIDPPFEKVLDIYGNIKNQLEKIGWNNQAMIYQNQIKLMKQKKEQDEKLRKIEKQKMEREKAYLDSLKIKKQDSIDLQKVKAVEEKYKKEFEDEQFQNQIDEEVTKAEKMIRTYELEIKKGNFEIDPPYQDVIEIYIKIKQQLIERGWMNQVTVYQNQIQILQDKIVQDNKLRQIEASKRDKKAEYIESMKLSERKRSEHKKLRAADDKIRRELEDEIFQKKIEDQISEANKLVRDYEKKIKKGNFEIEPPYQKVINMYKEIRDQLLEKNWKEEAMIYLNQIKLLKEKSEKDKILREIEVSKTEKEESYLEAMKLGERKSSEYKKILAAQERIKKEADEESFQKEIEKSASLAEKMVRNYEKEIMKGNFDIEPPYEKVIEIYEDIKDRLIQRNWKEQAMIFLNQINLIKEKLERDKILRDLEAEKGRKRGEFEELKQITEENTQVNTNIERLKEIESKRSKDLEDEKFQQEIIGMVDKAEEMARKYEFAIRQGRFEQICPYQAIIDIYTEAKNKLIEKGWSEQALVYTKQINLYVEKLEKDKKLREIETQKALKQKQYEESIKIKKDDTQIQMELEKLKTAEEQYQKDLDDVNFETEISKMVHIAEEMARKYEFAIRQGKFEQICPYQAIIDIYTEAIEKLDNRGWIEQSNMYAKQINFYMDKLENDKKLREIEAKKAQKQKDFEQIIKAKKEDKQLEDDIEKLKQVEEQYKKELEDEYFENEIARMVDEADRMARAYEIALRKGKFDERCPYPVIIEIYDQVRNKLIERGWNDEATIYKKQVDLYQEKLEQDKKLREIEELKAKKQKEFEEQYLTIKQQQKIEDAAQRIKAVEDKFEFLAEEEKFEREISRLVNKAEEMARRYEYDIRRGKFEEKCPYPEIIDIYKNLYQSLKEREWIDQALIYNNQIKVYQEKLEKDKKLREFEAQKEIKSKQMDELLKTTVSQEKIDLSKVRESETKKTKVEEKLNEGFDLIDEAENLVKDYELKLKLEKEILLYESPYEKAITLYRQARKIFQDNGWDNEADQLINTLNFYKEKKQKDDKLREFERSKLEQAKITVSYIRPSADKTSVERVKKALEMKEQKRIQEELSQDAFQIIDESERLAKRYELELKEGSFPDCPYERIIKMYRNARSIFEEIGWEDQATSIIDTINYYKEKAEADLKLRALEANKIESQKKEEEERQRIFARLKEKQEREQKLRQETLLLKNEKERELEEKKFKAYNFMDQAKRQLDQDNYDFAIDLYKESEKIFSEIGWIEGINMVRDSIILINNQKREAEIKEKLLKEEVAEKLRLERELEEEITKSKELERLQQELKREEMFKLQKQKEKEIQASEKAYSLLEEGTKLLEKKKFQEAYECYISAQDIFKELDWFHEVNRISNDLLIKLQIEETKHQRFEEYKKKKFEEKQELEGMLLEAEKQKKELREAKIKQKREKLVKLQVSDKLKDKIKESLERANIETKTGRYNKGVLKFREIIKMMERVGWDKEIAEINNQIHIIKNKSHVPIITDEYISEDENMDKFKVAYTALDKAHISILKNRLMKAISELNEAKFNLEGTKIGKTYSKEIDGKLNELKQILDEKRESKEISEIEGIKVEEGKPLELSSELANDYMGKSKKEELNDNFNKAKELATVAKEIYVKLGPEWAHEIMSITRYISTLENKQIAREESLKRKKEELEIQEQSLKEEEEEFKKRIAARRQDRKKRIQKLIKKED